ncbi:hypothetical protein FISHEDRAFT_69001 [Fistulina hepatica ATCC 64428]|uniref:Uncharacterized protein n=1 Tax=Fistulina hepatica ATCC 64428 TaxID=1128425 RepID=A0A0D7AQ06_9AGAR|nr:hypothetical protein FISHEDRAFT_69001 [Fistulina hepatica ATCC 64428]
MTAGISQVLLPPRTAALYDQLLRIEDYELSKKSVSWQRLLEVRHLKERMIRKCQALSTVPPVRRLGRGEAFTFQTLVAPEDFRLKEMERWLQQQHIQASQEVRQPPSRRERRASTSDVGRPAYAHIQSIRLIREPKSTTFVKSRVQPQPAEPKREPSPLPTESVHDCRSSEASSALPSPPESVSGGTCPTPPRCESPPPLPYLLRTRVANDGDLVENVPVPEDEPPVAMPTLVRRRSSLKRPNNVDPQKSVSWAVPDEDNDDELSEFAISIREARDSGCTWEQIRAAYTEKISALEALKAQVEQTLSRLDSETEDLRKLDASICRRLAALRQSFEVLQAAAARGYMDP